MSPSTILDDMEAARNVGDYLTLNAYFRNITAEDYGGVCMTHPMRSYVSWSSDERVYPRQDGAHL